METTRDNSGAESPHLATRRLATRRATLAGLLLAGVTSTGSPAAAATATQLAAMSQSALAELYEAKPKTRDLGRQAKAVLIFPEVVKAGLMVGGQGGEGAMLVGGQAVGFYQLAAASFGFQAGAQKFAYLLHPPSLESEGLVHTLRVFAAGFAKRTGLPVSVRAARRAERLPFSVEVALFRVAQEALMNVYRHARAKKAQVRLNRAGDEVVLEVEDNGVGLPANDRAAQSLGVGVSGMQARMLQLGGSFTLERRPVGVLVRATVPLRTRHDL